MDKKFRIKNCKIEPEVEVELYNESNGLVPRLLFLSEPENRIQVEDFLEKFINNLSLKVYKSN